MLNKLIASTLPYFPKKFIWIFSKKYVAGETIEECITAARQLNLKGIYITVDLLGEFIKTIDEAEKNKKDYLKIIEKFSEEIILGNFSIKPSSFGLLIDKDKCYKYIREVVKKASEINSFIRIDMEDSQCTTDEIELYKKLKSEYPRNVGIVFQAYLKRTITDIENLLAENINNDSNLDFRLCKGIYIEPEEISYKDYGDVRSNYLKILELMFKNNIYAGIATHDTYLIEEAIKLIQNYSVPDNMYEFQMLYGVAPNLRDRIVSEGHKMRVYVPYGKQWFGYCSRRIKENPKMVWDIMKAIFVKG